MSFALHDPTSILHPKLGVKVASQSASGGLFRICSCLGLLTSVYSWFVRGLIPDAPGSCATSVCLHPRLCNYRVLTFSFLLAAHLYRYIHIFPHWSYLWPEFEFCTQVTKNSDIIISTEKSEEIRICGTVCSWNFHTILVGLHIYTRKEGSGIQWKHMQHSIISVSSFSGQCSTLTRTRADDRSYSSSDYFWREPCVYESVCGICPTQEGHDEY